MARFVWLRAKMGITIRCTEGTAGAFLLSCDERPDVVEATAEDMRDESAAEVAFLRLWNRATGFEPFSVVRRHRGSFRRVCLAFKPAGTEVTSIRRGWHSAKVAFR